MFIGNQTNYHLLFGTNAITLSSIIVMLVQVTVNSGGVVFFALFNLPENDESFLKEAVAVIKFSSSRMATQSERLGYEFATWLGVRTPQVVSSYQKINFFP